MTRFKGDHPIGQPTGRPEFLGLVARRRIEPASNLRDPMPGPRLWEGPPRTGWSPIRQRNRPTAGAEPNLPARNRAPAAPPDHQGIARTVGADGLIRHSVLYGMIYHEYTIWEHAWQ